MAPTMRAIRAGPRRIGSLGSLECAGIFRLAAWESRGISMVLILVSSVETAIMVGERLCFGTPDDGDRPSGLSSYVGRGAAPV
jgi:hypothetical protein